jgi:hypothetical protein
LRGTANWSASGQEVVVDTAIASGSVSEVDATAVRGVHGDSSQGDGSSIVDNASA